MRCYLKIYTKTGDTGETGLLGGVRVSKSDLVIETCGNLDETNSLLGIAAVHCENASVSQSRELRHILEQIQNDLFDLGSRVAASQSDSARVAGFSETRSQQLELWIDATDAKLPPLREFILPGGAILGATLHNARTVCRRSERSLVALMQTAPLRDLTVELIYLNRLSDLLFVLARYANQLSGVPETCWKVTAEDRH